MVTMGGFQWRIGGAVLVVAFLNSGCAKKLPATICANPANPDVGPVEYTCVINYGTDASLSSCADRCEEAPQPISCVTTTIFFCAAGEQTPQELTNTCMNICLADAPAGADCKVCSVILDERANKPVCCGTNPHDPPPPFLKDLDGNPITTIERSAITLSVGSESASTSADGAKITYTLSNCDATTCDITFGSVRGDVANFSLDGHTFTQTLVESAHPFTGKYDIASSLFTVPKGAMTLYVYFVVDNTLNSISVSNDDQSIVGYASTTAGAFLLTGSANGTVEGQSVAIDLNLPGIYKDLGPPVARVLPSETVECTSPQGADVQLDASASTDPDAGDALRYFWFESGDQIAEGVSPSVQLPLGSHDILLNVLDPYSISAATTEVSVVDTTPPSLSASVTPSCLWPPNHKLVHLGLGAQILAAASDRCDGAPGAVYIANVSSNDPATTPDDIRFGRTGACVRAERSNEVAARIYTITLESVDAAGNIGTTAVHVQVPSSQGVLHCASDASIVVPDDDPACDFPRVIKSQEAGRAM